MKYRFCEGIVYSKVGNVHLLVATRSVWDRFPSVKRLSPLQGCFCYGIQNEMSEEALIDYLILPPNLKKEAVRASYRRFIENMVKEGYLIEEEELHDA